MSQLREMLYQSVQRFVDQIASALPNILAALVIFIVGWLVARFVRITIIKVLQLMRFNIAAWKTGIDGFLERGGVKYNLVELIGQVFYWIAMLLVLVAAVDVLGLRVASELLNRILLYLPNVIAAVLVLVLGLLFANFLGTVIQTSAGNAGFGQPWLLSQVAKYALIVFVAAIALEQLGVGEHIVVQAFTILFGAICLALALAFGLGGRQVAEKFLEKMTKETPPTRKDAIIE